MCTYREQLLEKLDEIVRDLSSKEVDEIMAFVETLQSQHTK